MVGVEPEIARGVPWIIEILQILLQGFGLQTMETCPFWLPFAPNMKTEFCSLTKGKSSDAVLLKITSRF